MVVENLSLTINFNPMKKTILTIIIIVFAVNVSAQLEVKSSGDTYVFKNIYLAGNASNFFGTTGSNIPLTFWQ